MKNGWSYRQYALYRYTFGLYLLVHFLLLLPYGTEVFSNQGMLSKATFSPIINLFPNIFLWFDSPIIVAIVLSAGAILSSLFMVGKNDRMAAFFIWVILTSLYGRNPFIGNPSLPFVGWLLIAHLFIPAKPKNPYDVWQLQGGIFSVAWIIMALGYSYSGWTKLTSPSWIDGSALFEVLSSPLARDNFFINLSLSFPKILTCLSYLTLGFELFFAPLALSKKLRPYLWLGMVLMHIGLLFFLRFIDLSLGMIILHLFTFDPAWIPPKKSSIRVFYDGSCGLCHRFIQFTLQELKLNETHIVFSPQKEDLKSIVVYEEGKKTALYKTKAIVAIFLRLGGGFRIFGYVLAVLPFTDFFYQLIAKMRHKFFSKPQTICPIVPIHLQKLFQDHQ
jgi:predicted DCC family thiol-disulfide oxidoreductase YuxK